MRYNDDSVLKVNKELLKPCDGIKIQVVGRLVEEQYIGVTKKSSCKKDLDLLITVKFFHELIMILSFNTKSVKKALCV